MLAARDQENLAHGHQTTAASKPLNQGTKQFPPKTPGNKAFKTPFKIPLNDENGATGYCGGKTALNIHGKGNENLPITGKKLAPANKDAFITPMGPRSRAPLGLKTTNAKAKSLQTPALLPTDNEHDKTNQKSSGVRKSKPRVSHAEMTKLEILGDKDELEEREIEYMPPPATNLPDYPDEDLHKMDFSMFEKGGLTRGYWGYYLNRPGPDGLSHLQREEQERQKVWDKHDKIMEATIQRDIDSAPIPCIHNPECPGEECKASIEAKKTAEAKWKKTVATLEYKQEPAPRKLQENKGPSTLTSKSAAMALSQARPTSVAPKQKVPSTKPQFPSSVLSRRQKTPPPSNPSPMRHTAAAVNSKNTMGYSKGRAASAALRKTVLPKKELPTLEAPDQTLAPAIYIQRYGEPRLGSEMWFRCKSAGCFDSDEDEGLEDGLKGIIPESLLMDEEAERDFAFTW